MHRIRIIILQRNEDAVTEALGQLGVIEFARTEEEGVTSRREDASERTERCRELKDRLESLMKWFGVKIPDTSGEEKVRGFSLDDVSRLMEQVENEAEPIGKRLNELDEKIEGAQTTIDQMAPYRELEVPPRELDETSFLHVRAGDMPRSQVPAARDELPGDAVLVTLGSGETGEGAPLQRVLALSSRRSRFALGTILEEHQFEDHELPTDYEASPSAIYEDAVEKRDRLEQQRGNLQGPLLEIGRAHRAEFEAAYRKVMREQRISRAEQNYGSTWATVIIDGWCPKERVEEVRRTVQEISDGSALFESRPATQEEIEEGQVPSHAELPDYLAPFERLVRGFGVPGYQEVEPTVMFALSFLLMFGVMFGDLGHGLILFTIGLAVWRRAGRETMKDLGYVIATAGTASALFGTFFQGSFFGYSLVETGWPLTLGIEPLRLSQGGAAAGAAGHVIRYMILAVGIGIGLISLGIILNIFSRLWAGEYAGGLLGRFGLAGGIFYWGTVGLVLRVLITGSWSTVDTWLLIGLVLAPLLVLAFHEPIQALIQGRKRLWEENPVFGVFQGLLEVMETVMTFVANTFSFLRVAAFALSHAALCFTIFVLQDVVGRLPAGALWSALIFLTGTAIVIALEGLIVAIQIFRLEYYEFFTKFFRGEGKEFKPFRLGQSERTS
jgi:V/A-type H+-transporting ATPase subunit I